MGFGLNVVVGQPLKAAAPPALATSAETNRPVDVTPATATNPFPDTTEKATNPRGAATVRSMKSRFPIDIGPPSCAVRTWASAPAGVNSVVSMF
jgi:hypothetical protein